jgi:hypothetical protein
MSIDYYGSFGCTVRERVTDEQLLAMEKARNRADRMLAHLRQSPGPHQDKPESEWTFRIMVFTPDGPSESEARISDLIEQSLPLRELAPACAGCPHRIRNVPFGCGGAINYPISFRAERWLVDRLPDDLTSPRGRLLLKAIKDFAYDGRNIDAARTRQELYESKVPAERTWGSWFSKKKITSSQILQMCFTLGPLQPAHARMMAYFLGFGGDDASATTSRKDVPGETDDSSVDQLHAFFALCALAGQGNSRVFIDA